MRRSSWISQWIDKLMTGDPLALGVAGFFLLLLVVFLVFFIIDWRDKAREKAANKGNAGKR